MQIEKMKIIYNYLKSKAKEQLKKFREWLNKSRFILAVVMLTIGLTGMFTYEHQADFQIIRTIEIKIADAYQESPAPAGGIQAERVMADKNANAEELRVSAPTSPEALIEKYDWDVKVATAIFKTESGMNERAMNWNCRYNGVSKQCLPEDRGNAWSVDCGIAQINVAGKVCPEELFNPEKNIAKAYAMYQQRGFQPWVSYVNDYHLVNL